MGRNDETVEGHVSDAPRIVLFGVNGQVGHRLLETLGDAGYEVTGIDRARCDLASATAKDIATIIRAVEPVAVINAAAYTKVDAAETDAATAHRINAEAPGLMAAACEEQHVPFLHFSTDYVFDGLRGAPYRADAPTHPLGTYAQTKRDGELAVSKHKGHIFRLQWVFDGRGKNFFLTMKKLLAERTTLNVVADQLGSPSHALHIAQAVVEALPQIIDGTIPANIYHLTAGGNTSWHGFACAIAKAMKSDATILPLVSAEYPMPATRPKDVRLDCSALASYGIAMPHWREGLREAANES